MPESTTFPTFDPAGLADAEPLLTLMRAFYAEEGLAYEDARARNALAALLADASLGRIWLVREGDALAGYVVVTLGYSLEFAGRFALLDEIYLLEPYRGRGWGRATLEHVANASHAAGLKAVRLEVEDHNARAYDLYGRAGYVRHERGLMTLFLDR